MSPNVTAMRVAVALAAASALRCSDAREACVSNDWSDAHASTLYVDMLSEGVLSAEAPHLERHLALTLSDLPELWAPEGAIIQASMTLVASWSYVELDTPPPGVEYPQLQLGFEGIESPSIETAPTDTKASLRLELFESNCEDAAAPCCAYGSRECTADVTLSVDQQRTADFPDLRIELQFWSDVKVDNCPLENTKPKLQLAEVAP